MTRHINEIVKLGGYTSVGLSPSCGLVKKNPHKHQITDRLRYVI